MAKDIYIDQDRLKLGLYALDDTTRAPLGTARLMKNMTITDRGGVSPRMGTEILGSAESNAAYSVKNAFNFKKSLGTDEIILKPVGTLMRAYSKNYASSDWFTIKTGFTDAQEFGFVPSLVNEDNQDYVIFCNRYEPYMRWTGEISKITVALSGGENTITVDSVLDPNIYVSETATGASATTVTVSGQNWATNQWRNFYVYITSGTESGKVRKIASNTADTLTFATLSGTPGTATFEIRRLKYADTGSLIYNNTEIVYTGIDTSTTFTVASAHAAPINTLVTQAVEEIEGAPRGNRMDNYLGRIIVGNVRSALSRDSGGTLQGSSSAGSYFVSKINENDNFDFSATRVPGEGDIIATPYGGGDITDVAHQENTAYIFKQRYIEAVQYSQDENDLAVRDPLKQSVGSINRVVKGGDDIYFMTPDKQLTTIGRVKAKDLKPQTENIGTPIKRLLETYGIDQFNGIEHSNKQYFNLKSSETEVDNNDIVLVYNKLTSSYEGTWDVPGNAFVRYNNEKDLYIASSTSGDMFKMNEGRADVIDGERYPIIAEYASHFMNLTPSKANLQSMNSAYFEGYIKEGSPITFRIWKDFSEDPFLEFTFSGEESLLDGSNLKSSLGLEPFGLSPLGSIGSVDSDGRRHFQFRVFFPFQQANYYSVGWASNGTDLDYEIIRYGLGISLDVSMKNNIKSV